MNIVFDEKPDDLYFHFRKVLEGHRFDGIAGGVQKFLEDTLCKWVQACSEETKLRRICFAGGVAQNIKALKKIAELDCVDDIFVCPAAGDTSLPLGGCYFAMWEYLCARQLGLDIIKPLLTAGEAEHRGTIIMGTVKGDLHDIGKNLVIMMMEGAGFRIVDMGVDVKIEDLIDTVKKEEADVLGLSALLTTTMPEMQKVIAALDEAGLRNQLKVIVGGAPIDQRFADEIGADGFGADAVEAVQLARELVNSLH